MSVQKYLEGKQREITIGGSDSKSPNILNIVTQAASAEVKSKVHEGAQGQFFARKARRFKITSNRRP